MVYKLNSLAHQMEGGSAAWAGTLETEMVDYTSYRLIKH